MLQAIDAFSLGGGVCWLGCMVCCWARCEGCLLRPAIHLGVFQIRACLCLFNNREEDPGNAPLSQLGHTVAGKFVWLAAFYEGMLELLDCFKGVTVRG